MGNNLWGRRFAALIMDIIVITLLMWIITAIVYPIIAWLGIFSILNYWIVLEIVLIITYFTIMEGKTGSTLGKKLLKIRVNSIEGELTYRMAFIRDLSKILWFPLIIDLILGLLFVESNDRILDKISKTSVVLNNRTNNTETRKL